MLIIAAVCIAGAAHAAPPEPTLRDVSYGPNKSDLLDFWKADSNKPTPLVIFIHGGGFIQGSKRGASSEDIRKCLAGGISFMSVEYPFYNELPLHEIIRDHIARSVQFARYKAGEWNIDKKRIVVYGESAGAGSSLWLAYHDDIADPANADPVLRESTRVTAAGAEATQATYDFAQWMDVLSRVYDKKMVKTWYMIMMPMALDMYHMKSEKELKTPEAESMRRDLDMLAMMDKNDPPVILETYASTRRGGDPLHTEGHPIAVKEQCDKTGLSCMLMLDSTPQEQRVKIIDFLIEHLK